MNTSFHFVITTSLTLRIGNASLFPYSLPHLWPIKTKERNYIHTVVCSHTINRYTMTTKSKLLKYAQRIAKENFTAYEFSKEFKLDYQNVCKFYRDYEKMPIKIAFMILDEMQAKLTVFRAK